MIQVVIIAWSTDSSTVGIIIESANAAFVEKAFNVRSLAEVPFEVVKASARNEIKQQWGAFINPNIDPLVSIQSPNYDLSDAFQNWRTKQAQLTLK